MRHERKEAMKKEPETIPIAKRYVEALEKGIRKACRLLAEDVGLPCNKYDRIFPFCKNYRTGGICFRTDDAGLCWYDYLAKY